jgi:hypothetical protein
VLVGLARTPPPRWRSFLCSPSLTPKREFIPRGTCPSRVSHRLLPPTTQSPVHGSSSQKSWHPSAIALGLAPRGTGRHSCPGSALGLSQPLSGFLASPSCAALFHAAAAHGLFPSESSPHKGRAPLSRPLAPLQLSTDFTARASRALSPLVSPDLQLPPERSHSPGSSTSYGFPFRDQPSVRRRDNG